MVVLKMRTVIEKTIIKEIQDLSEEDLNDVLDFIGYIKAKKKIQPFEKDITSDREE
jgi:hypothetical protein